jgi:hypothetical protein
LGPPRDVVRPTSSSITAAVAFLARCKLADRPFTAASSLLTLGLFLYSLAPFDFVTTTDALHASFGRAHWGLLDAGAEAVGASLVVAIAFLLKGAIWFARWAICSPWAAVNAASIRPCRWGPH